MKVLVSINQAAALKAGLDARSSTAWVTFDPQHLTPEQRGIAGVLMLHLKDHWENVVTLTTPTSEELGTFLSFCDQVIRDEVKAKEMEAKLAAVKAKGPITGYGKDYPGFIRRGGFLNQHMVDQWNVKSFLQESIRIRSNVHSIGSVAQDLNCSPEAAAQFLLRLYELGWERPELWGFRIYMRPTYEHTKHWQHLLPPLQVEEADQIIAMLSHRAEVLNTNPKSHYHYKRLGIAGSTMRGESAIGDVDVVVDVEWADGSPLGQVNLVPIIGGPSAMDKALTKLSSRLPDMHCIDYLMARSLKLPMKWFWSEAKGFNEAWRKSPIIEAPATSKDYGHAASKESRQETKRADAARAHKTIQDITRCKAQGWTPWESPTLIYSKLPVDREHFRQAYAAYEMKRNNATTPADYIETAIDKAISDTARSWYFWALMPPSRTSSGPCFLKITKFTA